MTPHRFRLRRPLVAAPAVVLATLALGPVAHARAIAVDPGGGNDGNPGTPAQPLRTLAAALGRAHAGDVVRLGAGTYSAATNGERYTAPGGPRVVVRSGVTIQGVPGELVTILQGAGGAEQALTLQGGASIRDVEVRGFRVGLRATRGAQHLRGVLFRTNTVAFQLGKQSRLELVDSELALRRSARATVADSRVTRNTFGLCSLEPQLDVADQARLALDSVALLEDVGGGIGIQTSSSKALRLRRTSIEGFELGVVVVAVAGDLGRADDPGGNTFHSAVTGVAYDPPTAGTLQAVGNTWQPDAQGADATGRYAPGTNVASDDALAHGPNFDLAGPGSAIVL